MCLERCQSGTSFQGDRYQEGSSTDAYPSNKDPMRFDETLAEIKNLDPVVYEMLRARLMTMWRQGVVPIVGIVRQASSLMLINN
jgi:hypothetical protein